MGIFFFLVLLIELYLSHNSVFTLSSYGLPFTSGFSSSRNNRRFQESTQISTVNYHIFLTVIMIYERKNRIIEKNINVKGNICKNIYIIIEITIFKKAP